MHIFIDALSQRNERIAFSKGHLKHLEDSLSCEPSKDLSRVTPAKLEHSMSLTIEPSTQLMLFLVPV